MRIKEFVAFEGVPIVEVRENAQCYLTEQQKKKKKHVIAI